MKRIEDQKKYEKDVLEQFKLMTKTQIKEEAEKMDPEDVRKIKGHGMLPQFAPKYQTVKKTELYRFGAQPSYLTNNMKEALTRHENALKVEANEQEKLKKAHEDSIAWEKMQDDQEKRKKTDALTQFKGELDLMMEERKTLKETEKALSKVLVSTSKGPE